MNKNKEPLTGELLALLDQVAKSSYSGPGGSYGYAFQYGYLKAFLEHIDHLPKVREEMACNINRLKADLKLQ